MPRWLEPGLHLSLIIIACAIVPVALATGVFMANRQKQAPAVHKTVSVKRATLEEETVNPPQAAAKSTVVDTAAATRETIAPRNGSAAPKAAESRDTAPRTEILTGALTRPVLRSRTVSGSSSATEPPAINGAPPREMDLGKDLFSTSLPAPVANPAGQLVAARVISSPWPIYPQVARMEGVQGTVVINAEVNESGQVRDMKVISGPAILRGAALEALRNWKYEPARLDGQPTATRVQVSINFSLK